MARSRIVVNQNAMRQILTHEKLKHTINAASEQITSDLNAQSSWRPYRFDHWESSNRAGSTIYHIGDKSTAAEARTNRMIRTLGMHRGLI